VGSIKVLSAHFSTEMGDLANSFYKMMQSSYVLRYGVDMVGSLAVIGLNLLNGLVILLCFNLERIAAGILRSTRK
jgi:hypothetical protein